MSDATLDEAQLPTNKEFLHESIAWWEKRRIWFNLAVGIAGVAGIVMAGGRFRFFEILMTLVYAVAMNGLYSTGFLLEALELHYFKTKRLAGARMPLLLIGIVASVLATFSLATFYYFLPFFLLD